MAFLHKILHKILIVVLSMYLVACNSSGGSSLLPSNTNNNAGTSGTSGGGASGGSGSAGTSGAGTTRAGKTYDVTLTSNIDAADIAITIHEPTEFTEGEFYPLILHSHGYSGSRQSSRPGPDSFIGQFLENGYGVLSLDERGNGESGGEVRILDPKLEGKDWLQVLDWVEVNLAWLEYDANGPDTGTGKGNPVMGSIGGSYGGGYQHMVYAIDNKARLDALAPDITWNNLLYSLFSGGVFKSMWGTLLAGLGTRPPNRQHQDISEGLAEGNGQNTLSPDKQDLLYGNSFESHCRGENDDTTTGGLRQIDAFYSQSHLDTLFNFNDLYHNFDCLRELGGDVRLMTKFTGHGLDNGKGSDQCGVITRKEATLAWYNEKLKGQTGAADYIPQICYNLGSTSDDGIIVNDVTVGGNTSVSFSHDNIVVGEAAASGPVIVSPALYTVPAGGDILAGIPTVEMTITDAAVGAVDPILFVGIGLKRGDAGPTRPLMNGLTPFRGLGDYERELVGVFERLEAGDELVLMLLPNSNANTASVVPSNAASLTSFSPPNAGDVGQYPSNGSSTPAGINITGTIKLPLIGTNHSAPTAP